MTRREREAEEARKKKAQQTIERGLDWIETPDSSNVQRFAYDRQSLQLHVVFKSDRHYVYFKVPRRVYEAMVDAPSRGEYVYWELRNGGYDNRFIYEEV